MKRGLRTRSVQFKSSNIIKIPCKNWQLMSMSLKPCQELPRNIYGSSKIKCSSTSTKRLEGIFLRVEYQERVAVLEQELASASSEVMRLTTQHKSGKDMVHCVPTAFVLQKMVVKHRASAHDRDLEKVMTDYAVVDTEIKKFGEDMRNITDQIQGSIDGNVARASALDSERVRLIVSKKRFERQLQFRYDDSQAAKNLKYQFRWRCC